MFDSPRSSPDDGHPDDDMPYLPFEPHDQDPMPPEYDPCGDFLILPSDGYGMQDEPDSAVAEARHRLVDLSADVHRLIITSDTDDIRDTTQRLEDWRSEVAAILAEARIESADSDLVPDIRDLCRATSRIDPWVPGRAALIETVVELAYTFKIEDSELERNIPVWVDVAAPAHCRVSVRPGWVRCDVERVNITDSTSVMTAHDSTLKTRDRYDIRRIDLDCRSLYKNRRAMEAFQKVIEATATGSTRPTPDKLLDDAVNEFHDLLGQIAQPAEHQEAQVYSTPLDKAVATVVDGADVVGIGDNSTISTTNRYRVRRTVVPLAQMLWENKDLIRILAGDHDPLRAVLDVVGDLDDATLLSHAAGLDHDATTVTGRKAALHVDLAAAVMVGYNNTLTYSSEIIRPSHTDTRDLERFGKHIEAISAKWAIAPTPPPSLDALRMPRRPAETLPRHEKSSGDMPLFPGINPPTEESDDAPGIRGVW